VNAWLASTITSKRRRPPRVPPTGVRRPRRSSAGRLDLRAAKALRLGGDALVDELLRRMVQASPPRCVDRHFRLRTAAAFHSGSPGAAAFSPTARCRSPRARRLVIAPTAWRACGRRDPSRCLDHRGVASDQLRREVIAQSATTDEPPVPIVYV
jgi:hypothetical protein